MSHARPVHPGATYVVSRHTERSQCLLRPDRQTTQFILYALIVAARKHNILVHAFCATPSRIDYVVTDPMGKLPRFLEMLHRLIALGIKAIRKWNGAVWNRSQTCVIELKTREDTVRWIAKTLANPVLSGLVQHAHQWLGAKTHVHNLGKGVLRAMRPNVYFSAKNPSWAVNPEIDITMPPLLNNDDVDQLRIDITQEMLDIESTARAHYQKSGFLGAERAATMPHKTRLTGNLLLQRSFKTNSDCLDNLAPDKAPKQTRYGFRAAYRTALNAWRSGNRNVLFPAGTYAMRVFHGVHVAEYRP